MSCSITVPASRSGSACKETAVKKLFVRTQTWVHGITEANERGGVAAEYGVLLAGVVAAVAVAAAALGGRLGRLFDSILP